MEMPFILYILHQGETIPRPECLVGAGSLEEAAKKLSGTAEAGDVVAAATVGCRLETECAVFVPGSETSRVLATVTDEPPWPEMLNLYHTMQRSPSFFLGILPTLA